MLNNLIGNAVKFSHPGTRVNLHLGCTDGIATVAVQDQGQGSTFSFTLPLEPTP